MSFVTGSDALRDHGMRTAMGAFAMTHVSNILLLDEEDLMREATALLLGNRGANVTKIATFDDAIKHLERRTYDVVIVDIQERAPDPAVSLKQIVDKASPPMRVIVCTDKPLPSVDASSITQLLVKPYPFDRLVEAVFGPRAETPRGPRPAVKSVARRALTHRRVPMLMRRGRA